MKTKFIGHRGSLGFSVENTKVAFLGGVSRNVYALECDIRISTDKVFFIMHDDRTSLDGQYAAFGKVIAGMEVVDELVKVKVEDDNGTVLKENQPIIISMIVFEIGEE